MGFDHGNTDMEQAKLLAGAIDPVQGIPNVWIHEGVRHWYWGCPVLRVAPPGTVGAWATWEPKEVEAGSDCGDVECVWWRLLTEGYLARLARADQLEKALRDFEQHGLRCDLNPTMHLADVSSLYSDFVRYLARADESVRGRASAALARVPAEPGEVETCGSFGCTLPKGHNMGRADIPENHASSVSAGAGQMVRVVGKCPEGCGETLFLGDGGHVTCSWIECPDPGAADDLLSAGAGQVPAGTIEKALALLGRRRQRHFSYGKTASTCCVNCDNKLKDTVRCNREGCDTLLKDWQKVPCADPELDEVLAALAAVRTPGEQT